MNIDDIERLLLDQFDYPSSEMSETLKQIYGMSESGKKLFSSLVETGVLPDVSACGLSLLEMKRQSPEMSPVALIILYDNLTKKLSDI